jgi:hypothetical protein
VAVSSTEWQLSSTKAEKAFKPAKAVAKMFPPPLYGCVRPGGRGGVSDGESADPPAKDLPRGAHEDDNLHFDPAEFENNPAHIPELMTNVTPRNSVTTLTSTTGREF